MPIDIIFSPDRVNNPFEAARRGLIAAISAIDVPAPYGSWPMPDDHLALRDHIRAMSNQFDMWLRTVGEEARANSAHAFDLKVFDSAYADAVDGWATYELEQQAELLRDDLGECAA